MLQWDEPGFTDGVRHRPLTASRELFVSVMFSLADAHGVDALVGKHAELRGAPHDYLNPAHSVSASTKPWTQAFRSLQGFLDRRRPLVHERHHHARLRPILLRGVDAQRLELRGQHLGRRYRPLED